MVKSTRKRSSRRHGKGDSRRLFVRRAQDMPSQLAVLREAASSFGPLAPHSMRRAARTALRGPGEYAVLGRHGSPRGYLATFEDAWDQAKHGVVSADSRGSEPAYGVFKADSKKQPRRHKRRTRRKGRKGGKGSAMREAASLRRDLGTGRGTKRKLSPSSSEKRRTRRRHNDSLAAAMKRLHL